MAASALSRRPGLAYLSAALGLAPNAQVPVLGLVVFAARLDERTPLRQRVRAHSHFRHRGASSDYVRYTIAGEAPVQRLMQGVTSAFEGSQSSYAR